MRSFFGESGKLLSFATLLHLPKTLGLVVTALSELRSCSMLSSVIPALILMSSPSLTPVFEVPPSTGSCGAEAAIKAGGSARFGCDKAGGRGIAGLDMIAGGGAGVG